LAPFGREDRSRKRFDANSLRCVGPQHTRDLGLRASVERTGEEIASMRIHLGVSVRSALATWPCARRSRGPERTSAQLRGRSIIRERYWNAKMSLTFMWRVARFAEGHVEVLSG